MCAKIILLKFVQNNTKNNTKFTQNTTIIIKKNSIFFDIFLLKIVLNTLLKNNIIFVTIFILILKYNNVFISIFVLVLK